MRLEGKDARPGGQVDEVPFSVVEAAALLDARVPNRYALMDLYSVNYELLDPDLDAKVRGWISETVRSTDAAATATLWRAILGAALIEHALSASPIAARRISQSPSSLQPVRRAVRIIAMVHELHKAGYQRIRISPGMSPSGTYWRCFITDAGNMEPDGYLIRDHDVEGGRVAAYTSADEGRYFGWEDSLGLSARAMAARFIERFPKIAAAGEGRDWMYAGWLTDLLGHAEQGGVENVPSFYSDDDDQMDPKWLPPLP